MIGFLGEYESTLDNKGRFLLPGGLKKQLPDGETRFVISRGFEKCLNLYPMKTWEEIMERIGKLNDFDPKVHSIYQLRSIISSQVFIGYKFKHFSKPRLITKRFSPSGICFFSPPGKRKRPLSQALLHIRQENQSFILF